MEFAPHTDHDVEQMLATLQIPSIDALFTDIPERIRLDRLDLPPGRSEVEVLREMGALAARNRSVDDLVCFLGAGAYDHHVPSIVWPLLSRGEFATSYTPYQPELSQGVLQALFEYQTMVCELTGLDIANAGLYDAASGLAEAVNMAVGATGRTKIVMAGAIDLRSTGVLRTQGAGLHLEIGRTGWAPDGTVDRDALRAAVDGAAAVIVQHPNFFGCVEDVEAIAAIAHEAGARMVVQFDLTAAGILEPPGSLGADIVVSEGQPFGNHLNFGGPYAGILACRTADVRRLPGRLVGETVDRTGARAFVLTLQAREQHIRREKATSNICTNQTLNTLAVAVALAWLGPQGLREMGELCLAKAHYARERLLEIPGVEPAFDGAFFKEFCVRLPVDARAVTQRCAADGYLAGLAIDPRRAGFDGGLLVAVTEKRTREEIDGLADAIARACKEIA